MGANRKLQGEIDRVLKKVQEGVELFDSIWNKVYDTDNANQKEKFEVDLKKEIKKLQRYRDQIKTWIQSSDIKDKKALMDARKLIEKEMERFKIFEKETKTKAFSKEGLEQQPKTDPKEKAKSETRDWLNNTVSELESQIDTFEAEIEGISVKKGKARPPRLTHLESSITRHKAHIMKLELILRLLDNDELSPEQVNDVKDFLDDYVERNQDDFDDFDDVDMLYNTLPLDKVESLEDLVTISPPGIVKGVGATSAVLSIKPTLSTSAQPPATVTVPDQIDAYKISEILPKTPPPKTIPISPSPTVASTSSVSSSVKGILDNTSTITTLSVPSSSISTAIKEEEFPNLATRKPSTSPKSGVTNLPSLTIPISSGIAVSSSGIVQPLPQAAKTSDAVSGGMTGRVLPSPSGVPGIQWRPGTPFQSQHEGVQFRGRTEIAPDQREKFLERFQQVQQQGQTSTVPAPPQSVGSTATSAPQQPTLTHSQSGQHPPTAHPKAKEPQVDDSAPDSPLNKNPINITDSKVSFSQPEPARDIDLSPGQPLQATQSAAPGVIGRRSFSDLGVIGDSLSGPHLTSAAPLDQQSILELLNSAFYKLPQPNDSERPKIYTAKHPAVTSQYYPQVQAPIINNPAFWERIGSGDFGFDTLFFAFYYQQNTYQQYLAAKELKRQSWRYHKKHHTWFQRHHEPKLTTNDYEQGTYIYFDFHIGTDDVKNGWCRKVKADFKFEYSFLEEELTV